MPLLPISFIFWESRPLCKACWRQISRISLVSYIFYKQIGLSWPFPDALQPGDQVLELLQKPTTNWRLHRALGWYLRINASSKRSGRYFKHHGLRWEHLDFAKRVATYLIKGTACLKLVRPGADRAPKSKWQAKAFLGSCLCKFWKTRSRRDE